MNTLTVTVTMVAAEFNVIISLDLFHVVNLVWMPVPR